MSPEEYVKLTSVTDHQDEGYQKILERLTEDNQHHVYAALEEIKFRSDFLDQMKKKIIYGKDNGVINIRSPNSGCNCDCFRAELDDDYTAIEKAELFHSLIGVVTEAGEIADVLQCMMGTGQIDKDEVIDEFGDILWYMSRACRTMGISFEEVMYKNIAKLKVRFGDKYTKHAALNRDKVKEGEAQKKITKKKKAKK